VSLKELEIQPEIEERREAMGSQEWRRGSLILAPRTGQSARNMFIP